MHQERTISATHRFDLDTAVTRIKEGSYAAALGDQWNALGGSPNGGYTLAVSLRALADAMHESGLPDPLVVSGFFLRRASPGPAEVRTEIARVGKHTITGESHLLREGQEIVRTLATFTDRAARAGRRRCSIRRRPCRHRTSVSS